MSDSMLSWLRQQIELRKSLAEAASGESWAATRVMDVGYMVADKGSGAAVARLWVEMGDLVDGFHAVGVNPLDTSKHIAFNDPRQIIADCEADLDILSDHEPGQSGQPCEGHFIGWCAGCAEVCKTCPTDPYDATDAYPCPTVRRIASRYQHRPGYLPEWAPEGATP